MQIVYYPPAAIPRMTNRQLLRYVLIVGMGSFTITAALALIIKVIKCKYCLEHRTDLLLSRNASQKYLTPLLHIKVIDTNNIHIF